MELVQEKRKHVDKKGSGNLTKTKGKQRGKKIEKENECSNLEIDPVQLHSKSLVSKESKEVSKLPKESLTSVQPTTFLFVEEKVETNASGTSITEEMSLDTSEKQQLPNLPKLEETNDENNIVIDIKPSNILLEETTKSPLAPLAQDSSIDQNQPDEIETKSEKSQSEPEIKIIQTDELTVSLEQKSLPTKLENPAKPENDIQSSKPENDNTFEQPQIQSENKDSKKENENDNKSCQESKFENQVELQIESKEEISDKTEEKNQTPDEIQSKQNTNTELQNLDEKGPTDETCKEKSETDNQKYLSEVEKEEVSTEVQIKPTADSPENKCLDSKLSPIKEEPELSVKKIPSEVANISNGKDLEKDKEKVQKMNEESSEEIKDEKVVNSIPIEKENTPVKETPIATPEVATRESISFHPWTKMPTQLSYKISTDNPHFEQNQIPYLNPQVKKDQVHRIPFPTTATDNTSASMSEVESESNPLRISSSLTEEQRDKILQEPELREFVTIPEFQSQFKIPNYKILHLQNLKNGHKFQGTHSSMSPEEKVPLPISWKKLSEDLGFECLDTEQDEAIAFYTMILWDDLLPPRPTVTATAQISQKSSQSQGYIQNNQIQNGRPAMSVMSDFFEERERDSGMNGFRSESDTLIEKDSIYPENSWEYSGSDHQYCQQNYYSDSPKSRKNSSCHHHLHQNYGYDNPRHHHHQHHHRHLVGTNPNPTVGRSEEAPLFRGKRCRIYTATAANLRTKTRLRLIKNNIEGGKCNQLENSETVATTTAAPSSSPWMKTKRMFSKARTVVRSAFRIKGKTEDVDDRNPNTNPNANANVTMTKNQNQALKNGADADPNINGEKRVESDFFLPDVQDVDVADDKLQKSENINNTQNENPRENDTQGMDELMRDFYYHMDLIDEEMLLAAVQAPDPPTTTTEAELDSETKTKGNENEKEVVKIMDTNGCEQISISNNKETDKK